MANLVFQMLVDINSAQWPRFKHTTNSIGNRPSRLLKVFRSKRRSVSDLHHHTNDLLATNIDWQKALNKHLRLRSALQMLISVKAENPKVIIGSALAAQISPQDIFGCFSQVVDEYGKESAKVFDALPEAFDHGLNLKDLELALWYLSPEELCDLLQRDYSKTVQQLRILEGRCFPEFKKDVICGIEDIVQFRAGQSYALFSPSWHYGSGLLSDAMLSDLNRSDKTLLSIGAGPAHLERLLVALGAAPSQIVLADIEVELLPQDFQRQKINMFKEWPDLGRKFDFIIFPESFLTQGPKKPADLLNILKKALKLLQTGGQIRISPIFVLTDQEINQIIEELRANYNLAWFAHKNRDGYIRSLSVKLLG